MKLNYLIFLLSLITMMACNQSGKESRQNSGEGDTINNGNERKEINQSSRDTTKLDKSKIPKEVTVAFAREYPATTSENWYGYPLLKDESLWYDYDPYYKITEIPGNYIVEFNMGYKPYFAIYAKNGIKIATHRRLDSDIPKLVSDALNKSEYKNWKIGKDKEEIFRDSDQVKVYKINVEKESENHILYFLQDGKLLKDKIN